MALEDEKRAYVERSRILERTLREERDAATSALLNERAAIKETLDTAGVDVTRVRSPYTAIHIYRNLHNYTTMLICRHPHIPQSP